MSKPKFPRPLLPAHVRKQIRCEASAIAYLVAAGEDSLHSSLETRTNAQGEARKGWTVSARCTRCGGSGYGGWLQDGGRCYECHGADTRNRTRFQDVVTVARKLKSAAAKQVKVDWETAQERAAADVWLSARPELAAVLALGDDRGKRQQVILQQLAWKAQRGPLSDAQVDLAFKLADQLATEPQPAEIAAGRREITGKLVAIKESFGAYGSSLRATVVHIEGGKKAVFNGTLPRSLYAAKVGDEVSMTATVEPRDEGFAFFKRPTKAVVVGGEEPDTCSACGDSEVYLLAHPAKDVMICEMCHDNVMDDAYENGYA